MKEAASLGDEDAKLWIPQRDSDTTTFFNI
jgi:hypothetical protein